jgi:PAP2 superfamily
VAELDIRAALRTLSRKGCGFKSHPQHMKKIGKAEGAILASIIATLVLFFVIGFSSGFAGGGVNAWVSYYRQEFGGSLPGFFAGTVLFLCLVVIGLVTWSLGMGFLRHGNPQEIFIAALKRSRDIWLIIPAILFILLAGLVMGEMNYLNRGRLMDTLVIGWEHALFGNYVFAALGAIHYPHWLIVFIIFSFQNMSTTLIVAGILMAYINPKQFRRLLIAFCVGILIMIPIWFAIPVLSPQDRFINNIYYLPTPPSIAVAVAHYHPQTEIVNFLTDVRTGKADLPALPTSTFPSAHVFWAALAGYYLFRLQRSQRWIAWIALPFLIASTFGTILLAQHYFMDIPIAMLIGVLAIWLANNAII